MKKKNYKQTKSSVKQKSNVKQNSQVQAIETSQPAEVVTGSLHNQVSKVMSAILIASLFGMFFLAWMFRLNLSDMIKDSILVIVLDFILMFYVQINKDKINFQPYNEWLLGASYLASILLLCNPYEISLYPFWLIGVVLIAAYINPNFSHVVCYGLIIIAAVTNSYDMNAIVMNILLGTFMCMMARSVTNFSKLCYALVLVVSMNITLLFAMNNFKPEKVMENSIGLWILADVSVLGIVFVLKHFFPPTSNASEAISDSESLKDEEVDSAKKQEKEQVTEQIFEQENKNEQISTIELSSTQASETEGSNHSQDLSEEQKLDRDNKQLSQALITATAIDAPLLVQMKAESEKLYHHSMVIANLSKHAALSIDADAELAYAGGWYHEIGRLTGKEYVPNGVALIHEHHLPEQIADIIHQHTFKEQLPQTKEAAIVMLSDNIVSTVQYVKNHMDTQITPEKVIENTFSVRMNKGTLNEANITIADFTKLKEFYLSVVEELR